MSLPESNENMREIDLTKLSLQQLTQFKQRLDQELQLYQNSLQSLKMAQTRYTESRDSLEKVTHESSGKDIMIPLTGSIYVPGKIANVDSVIIDIGTGYYVEKDLSAAKDYMGRRVTFVTEQMEKIQSMGLEKSAIRDAIIEVMEGKIQQDIAMQRAALAAGAPKT